MIRATELNIHLRPAATVSGSGGQVHFARPPWCPGYDATSAPSPLQSGWGYGGKRSHDDINRPDTDERQVMLS
jgi:hypothetical protein